MTGKTVPTIFSLALFLLIAAQPVHAHRMRVFAYESGGTVHAEVKFNSGRAARDVTVTVVDENGAQLLSGTTDQAGMFTFPLPESVLATPSDLTITADAGEGHRGTWLLEKEEYAASPSPPAASSMDLPASTVRRQQQDDPADTLDTDYLEEVVRQAVAAELAPVKKMLAEQRHQSPSLRDILGGIGYLIGFAGVAAYFRSRKTTTNGDNQ